MKREMESVALWDRFDLLFLSLYLSVFSIPTTFYRLCSVVPALIGRGVAEVITNIR